MFKPAQREKISTQIIRQIRTAIMRGDLTPGQALPNEKALMAEFDVSKHTLREALRALEAMGFITIKRGAGGGPVVSEIDWVTARNFFASFLHFQKFDLSHITEVRKLIEPFIARKAAEIMTEEDIENLLHIQEKCIEAFRAGDTIALYENEVQFHVTLGKKAGNPILWVTLDFVNNLLADAKHHLNLGKDFAEDVIKAHQHIIEAIAAHDGDKAETAMYEHICQVARGLPQEISHTTL